MFGPPRNEPPPPERTVWADETKKRLADINRRRTEFLAKIDAEAKDITARCNHTHPDGTSALRQCYDDWDDNPRHFTKCDACQAIL